MVVDNPWLSLPVALVIAALVTVGTLTLFTTSPTGAVAQDERPLPDGIANASEDGLIAMVDSGSQDQQIAALMKLAESPQDLAKVVPTIARAGINRDELIRASAEVAIKRLGPAASEHLGPLFESKDFRDYQAGCFVAQKLGPDAKQWIPSLTKELKSDDPNRIMSALFGLQNMGTDVLPAMDTLISLLGHDDFNIQCGVCRIFERLGSDAAPAQDRLVELLDQGVVSSRSWAAVALGAIGPTEKHDVVDLLEQKLNAFTQIEKERALIGLAHIGPEASNALPQVERLMYDLSKSTQCQAALTYWRITGDADKAIKVLVEQLPDESYKREAIQRLGEMGPAAAPALDALIKELKNPEEDVCELAVMAIAKMGAVGKPAIPHLQALLMNKDLLLQQAAGDAIKTINAAPEKEE
jgi:hypothetical protein